MIKYIISLTQEEREKLLKIVNKGIHSSPYFKYALILLNSDTSKHPKLYKNKTISDIVHVSMKTIERIKKKFIEEGFDSIFTPSKSKRKYIKKTDGELEAHLIALCCSNPPDGFSQWSLRLLADKAVELNYVESISHETVRQVLKKMNLSPGKR